MEHGGKRKGAGNKYLPEGKKKRLVALYIEGLAIERMGGLEVLKQRLKLFIENQNENRI